MVRVGHELEDLGRRREAVHPRHVEVHAAGTPRRQLETREEREQREGEDAQDEVIALARRLLDGDEPVLGEVAAVAHALEEVADDLDAAGLTSSASETRRAREEEEEERGPGRT